MNTFNTTYALNKLNKPVDFDDWELPSFIVNAYFNPTRNEILFPAAILQPPFLDLSKSHIYNYSNIGSVIGHEIIHGFDDQGAKFDENGSVTDWWQQSDKTNYEEKVKKIRKVYDNEGIDGKLTAGENIADFGAVIMPLIGLKYKLMKKLTDDEIREFYTSYASHWQYLIRPEAAEERKLSDPHAFSDLRVNIPLKHSTTFQRVFNIKMGNKMYVAPENILVMW
jgi:putative endopeptidase